MRAFGPYAQEQVLDFGVLEERSFFLIHGPTGAGKTSILDAICFALYGETSGGERQIRHMRSDHADPGVLTEVTFDFTLGVETYRVFRRPEQDRPKKRGSGMTKEPAKATIWKRTGVKRDEDEGAVIAERWSRVNEEIERLLGFRSDQFRQVVVLPQGQFRKLLSAGSSERQQILEVLFQTGIYRQVEEALKDAADQTKTEVERLREKKKEILERLGAKTLAELDDKLADATKEKDAIENAIKTLRQEETSTEKDLENAKEVVGKLKEYEKAKTALHNLEARKDEFKEKHERLARARKASRLKDIESELRNREEERAEAQKNLETAHGALESAQKEKARADEEVDKERSRQGERDSARREVDKLESLRTQVEELAGTRHKMIELEGKVQDLTRIRDEKRTHLEECDHALQEAQKGKEAAVTLAAQVDARKLEYDNLQRAYERRKQLEKLYKDHKKADAEFSEIQCKLKQANEDRSSASKELDLLEERWRKGQAAVLARQLKAGTPCPVCGSTEHPLPAKDEGELPAESNFELARERLSEIDNRIKELQKEASSSRERVVKLKTQIGTLEGELEVQKDEDILTMKCRVEEVKSLLDEAEKAKERLSGLEAQIKELDQAKKQAEKEAELAKNELQKATMDLAVAKSSVEQSESKIPEELRTKERLEEAITKARNKYQELETAFRKAQEQQNNARVALAQAEATLKNAKETEIKARNLAVKARKNFLSRIEKSGFANAEDYEVSRMEEEAIEQLDAETQEFNGKLREADERVRRTEKEAKGLEKPELEPIEEKCAEIKKKLEELLRRSGEVNKHIEQLSSAVRDVGKVDKEIGEKEAYYGIIGRLAEVASGRNPYNITFERFVLATLLDDVLAAASTRLQMMSNGRFDLQRLTGVDDRRKAGGLDLVVYDAYTGTTRPVNTLSGGEGFLASLSLALGLADVVQSYAGGIKLDTIFIDEGFGSLDPESLDLALRALVDLQKEGRLVGIISHVPELKERVDVRLEVLPSKRGSEARFVF
jgi:exonuclease SbcC